MQSIRILLLLFILCLGCGKQVENTTRTSLRSTNHTPLFQITENDKIGFIDSTGRVVIPPQFRSAGDFSEGLASVRLSGTYGYIDATGTFIIPPQFDYATPFSGGLAVVYRNGMPSYIHPNGEQAFECTFPAVGSFENGRALVRTASKKYGMIDTHGKLFIDTVYSEIRPFSEGRAVVVGINKQDEVGVIDTLGRILIPYGKYKTIEPFTNGFTVVEGVKHSEYSDPKNGIVKKLEIGVIDTLDNVVVPYGTYFRIEDLKGGYFRAINRYQDSLNRLRAEVIFLTTTGRPKAPDTTPNTCKIILTKSVSHVQNSIASIENPPIDGVLKKDGTITFTNAPRNFTAEFLNNPSGTTHSSWQISAVDTLGNVVPLRSVGFANQLFSKGAAVVTVDYRDGLIDTNGKFIFTPQFSSIDRSGMRGDNFFFSVRNREKKSEYDFDYLKGIASLDGRIILKPCIQEYYRPDTTKPLLTCFINFNIAYINHQGKIIWQDGVSNSVQSPGPSALNIDYQRSGYFRALSANDERGHVGPGFESYREAQSITEAAAFAPNTLSINVHPEMPDTFTATTKGVTVFVANTTDTTIRFEAQDNRLPMIVQALSPTGEWRDIENLPSSWCGNSYHTISLLPKMFWKFISPEYEGNFKTKLRIKLTYIDPNDTTKTFLEELRSKDMDSAITSFIYSKDTITVISAPRTTSETPLRKEITIYSNEYPGSVNPAQFWRKERYYPTNIMDPYSE
ncbi:MAG: WG repeat-containing protein [Candidatus Kapaibacterium sp.]